MTSEIDDDGFAGRIAGALHHRAASVVVDDRLDSITDGLSTPGGLAPVYALVPSPPRRRTAPRLAFAAAAVLVAAALSLALWQRGEPEPLAPVSGPTPDAARIYPILDPATLEGIGLTPDPQAAIQGTMSSTTGPALVLRRVAGDGPGDVITVWVASPVDAANGAVAVNPPDPVGPLAAGLVSDPVTIGDRTVRQPYGGADASPDFLVWLDPAASDAEVEAVQALLDGSPDVRSSSYLDHDAIWAEFQRAYADQPQVLDLVDANDLPTSFRVDLATDDSDRTAALRDELQALPVVNGAVSGGAFERYEWNEADAAVVVDGPRDTGPTIEALIADLAVLPRDGELPLVRLDRLPDGWEVLAGPSVPTVETVPVLNLAYGTGTASLNVTRQPSFVPQNELTPVQVGGRAGYLTELEGQGFTLTWALAEEGWWAQMAGYGVGRDQAIALAEGVTFTDKAVWSARYPAPEATDPADSAPPTTAQP